MKIIHEAGSRIVTLDTAAVGDIVRYHGFYRVVVRHDCLGRGLMCPASGVVEFGLGGGVILQVVDAELVIRDEAEDDE